jgi:hypothetical protein
MIDEIFKIRFIEEVANIVNARDKKTKLRLRLFAILSFILALGSTVGIIGYVIDLLKGPEEIHLVHYLVILILSGFSITFLLTLVIFAIAYARIAVIRSCFKDLSLRVEKGEVSKGGELAVDVGFCLIKRKLNEIKLILSCEKETILTVLDIKSIKKTIPYKKEVVLGKDLNRREEPYHFDLKLMIPEDALESHLKLTEDKDKVIWWVTVHFDFLNWHSYKENIPFMVIQQPVADLEVGQEKHP